MDFDDNKSKAADYQKISRHGQRFYLSLKYFMAAFAKRTVIITDSNPRVGQRRGD